MGLLKTKNNKVYLPENTLIFEDTGVKIVTGVNPLEAKNLIIGDQTINPGDTIITTEGNQLVKKSDNTYTDLSKDISRLQQTVSGAVTAGPQVFTQMFDFNEALYTSANGYLEILVSAATNVVQLYEVYSVYDSLTTNIWYSTLTVVASNGQALPAGVSFTINSAGRLQYNIATAPVTSITAKFRGTVL